MTPDEVSSGSSRPQKPRQNLSARSHLRKCASVYVLRWFVKIVIVSDIHSNFAALEALPEREYDLLWCIGDLVDYGPQPREVIKWVKERANVTVRGNHDHAVGYSVDPQCSAPFRRLAAVTREYTQGICTIEDIEYLRSLPVRQEIEVEGASFYLVHATPFDPLFGYCPERSERWRKEVELAKAQVLVVGHTHAPFVRRIGGTTIVNPGSLGQPKTGRPFACYAVWEDGKIALREYEYPLIETARGIRRMGISPADQDALISVLKTGTMPNPQLVESPAAMI